MKQSALRHAAAVLPDPNEIADAKMADRLEHQAGQRIAEQCGRCKGERGTEQNGDAADDLSSEIFADEKRENDAQHPEELRPTMASLYRNLIPPPRLGSC